MNRGANQQLRKRVRFSNTSQQWRLKNNGERSNSVIDKNLSQIKKGLTPLKKAQEAYYGNNRSPLLKNNTEEIVSKKLPVHARLGNKGVKRLANDTHPNPGGKITVKRLLEQKRALRAKALQHQTQLKQLGISVKKRNNFIPNKGGMRSDVIVRSQQPQHIKINRTNNIRRNTRPNKNLLNSVSDYRISVALPQTQQITSTNISRVPSRRLELNPQIQREIAMIQQRHYQTQTVASVLPPAIPGLTVDVNSSNLNFHRPIGSSLITSLPISLTSGINRETTTTIIPQRKKITLHERFSQL